MGGEWKRVQFSDAVWVNPPVPLKRGENYPFVEMQNVNPSERAARSKQSRPFTGGGARFAAGDTLMARITPCLENGKTARFVSEDDQAIAHGSTEFIVIRGRPGVSDTNFAYYLTRWREVQDFAISQMTGTSGRQRVPTEALSHLTVPLPPLPEQKAIASVLGALDDKIELNRRTNETLETMARAVFKSWFVDFDPVHAKSKDLQPDGMDADTAKLFPSSFVDFEIGRVPKGWKVVPIYEIADVIYGAPFSSALFNDKEGGRPLIRIRDLPKECPGVWTPEVHPKGYLVHAGDVVVGMDGEFRAYLWGGSDAWLNQRVCVFVPRQGVSAAFVRESISGLLAEVEATETATTVIHLGKNDIDRFKVIVPDPQVLAGFNRHCQPLYDAVIAKKQESRTLACQRDALLPRLLSGELTVPASKVA